jgi:putative PIN family toxin of toxin-antitoxin system
MARRRNVIALSSAVEAEIRAVLARPKFDRHITAQDRAAILALIADAAVWCEPRVAVTDCRDKKDNIYLELAIAAGAEIVVSSDFDPLELDPWRGVRVLRPRDHLHFEA